MAPKIEIIGLKGVPLINPGDNISQIIFENLKNNKNNLENGDIFVIAQTIISKSEGRIVSLDNIKPTEEAYEIYRKITPKAKERGIPIKEPELIQAVLDESQEILKIEHVIITETKHGFVCANAGIDKSNIEGERCVALLPKNSDVVAEDIRQDLKKLTNKDVAVIISDSFGRPFRIGAIGVALGISGIRAVLDKRGSTDLFGHKLETTLVGQVDNLTSAAQLIMGEANEGLPIIIIRGYKFDLYEKASISNILREKDIDLFREDSRSKGFAEILKKRRSYKSQFDSKHIKKELIKECIDLARWAPNAHNAQTWRYILLEKGAKRESLINDMNKKLREDLIKDGKSKVFIKNKINTTRSHFLEAPMLVLLCLDEHDLEKYPDNERNQNEFILGVQSISASATYLLLAFENKGLAASWYCAPLFAKKIVQKALNLPDSLSPMAFFTVGYPRKTIKAPKRKKLNDIIYNLNEK